MQRVNLAIALAAPTVRAMRWLPYLAASGVGLFMVAAPAFFNPHLRPDDLAVLLRLAGVCAGMGLAFLFDDPAKPSIATMPAPRWLSLGIRGAVGAVAGAAWWAVAVWIARRTLGVDTAGALPVGGLTVEVATVLALSFGFAVLCGQWAPRGITSTAAAPALLVVAVAVALLPDRLAVVVGVGDPRWAAAHRGVLVLLVIGLSLPILPQPSRRRRAK
jgi:hypothetical protein